MNTKHNILKNPINFENPVASLYQFENLLKILSIKDFLKFLDSLDPNDIKKLSKKPQQTNINNFIEFLLTFYDDLNLKSNYSSITDKIFKNKRLGPYFIDYIKKNLIDCEGY
ncbi:MAG: hypothetical protein ACTSRT_21255, partial [Promethearchaeota archaeon]